MLKKIRYEISRIFKEHSLMEMIEWTYRRNYGLATGSLRLLPDFIIIGAQRSGTTSLFTYLCRHPQIHPSFPKEVHYFSNFYHKGVYWYRSHFPLSITKILFESYTKQKFITGEATPYYLSHPLVSERMSELLPNVKLILILRNPVDRAYSHYHHQVRLGFETLSFEEAIEQERKRIKNEIEILKTNDHYKSFNHQNFSYLSRGQYIDHLQVWFRYFNREQALVLESDDFKANPALTIRSVFNFLGVPKFEADMSKNYNVSRYPPMDVNTRKQLFAYFKPYNQKLFDYLGLDLLWNDEL